MATGGADGSTLTQGQPQKLGFPLEIVDGGNVDSKFLCALCELVLRNPMQSFCGHRFCRLCINNLLHGVESEVCPSCKKEGVEIEYSTLKLDQIFPDNAIKRDFINVKVKCLNVGCPWTGNLKVYEEHEKSCEYLSVKCEFCGQNVAVPKKAVHDAEECPARILECRFCSYRGPACDLQDHLDNDCTKKPIDCQYCNTKGITRDKLLRHYETECPSGMSVCPVVRCGYVGLKEQASAHKQENALGHIDGINIRLQHLEREFRHFLSQQTGGQEPHSVGITTAERQQLLSDVSHKIAALESQLKKVQISSMQPKQPPALAPQGGATGGTSESEKVVLELVEQRMNIQDQKIATFESIAAVLNSEILKCLQKIDDTVNKINATNTQVQELAQKVQSLEESNREKTEILNRLQREVTGNVETSYDGSYIWKITEVGRRRQEALTGRLASIYSPAFYTSRTGYKMCLRMYLNGDGMGRGSHLSVYFVLMRGPYDALLRWPFRQKVTLMLLDHNRRENVIDAFRPDPSSSSFRQPTSEMNIASGCPLFTPLATLDATGGSKEYIKHDTMFIKCIVDTTDLV